MERLGQEQEGMDGLCWEREQGQMAKKSICPCVLGGQGRFYFMFSLAYETMTLSLSTWLAPGQGLPYQGPCF